MEIPLEQRVPILDSGMHGSIGFNFGEAMEKPVSFNFASMLPPAQLSTNLATASTAAQFNIPATFDDSIVQEEAPSKFAYLYKTKGLKDAQKLRMEEYLRRQKQRRYDFQSHVRQLTELVTAEDEQTEVNTEQMDWKHERKPKHEEAKKHLGYFRNQLMFSEWFLEKPERFEEDWLMVPAPKGRRNLVISTAGSTVSYAKNGMFINRFSSHLPGGGKHKHKWNVETAILDCIYNENTKTYYILDMMFWKQTPLYDTETQFRFYWLKEKIQDVPEVVEISRLNPYRFEPLPNFACLPENISNLIHCDMNIPLDGLLFYHKETHYMFGDTPLVLWLKPYMLPEALGIAVPQVYTDLAPPSYTDFASFREKRIAAMAAREQAELLKREQKRGKHGTQKKNKTKLQVSTSEDSMQM